MIVKVPLEIQHTKQKIKLKKELISRSQRELEELVFLLNKQLHEELNQNLSSKNAFSKRIYSKATQEIIKHLKKNKYDLLSIKENLTDPIHLSIFGSKLVNQLQSRGYYFVWQIAQYSEDYWSEVLGASCAKEIKKSLGTRGLCLGINYLDILHLDIDSVEDFKETTS